MLQLSVITDGDALKKPAPSRSPIDRHFNATIPITTNAQTSIYVYVGYLHHANDPFNLSKLKFHTSALRGPSLDSTSPTCCKTLGSSAHLLSPWSLA